MAQASGAMERGDKLDHPTVVKILRAAGSLFARRGYHGASLLDVAREAGVSKSLLHYHFDSKEHLFLELQILVYRDLLEQVREVTTESAESLPRFHRALERVMGFIETHIGLVSVLLEFRTVLDTRPEFGERLEAFHEEVIALFEAGIRNTLGAVPERVGLPPERLARLLATIFHGLLVDLSFAPSERARALIRQTFADMQGLLARALVDDGSVHPPAARPGQSRPERTEVNRAHTRAPREENEPC